MTKVYISGYLIGIIAWFLLWKLIDGFFWQKKYPLLYIPFLFVPLGFLINIAFLYFFSAIPFTYETELNIYSYVEQSARVITTLSLACILLITFTTKKNFIEKDVSILYIVYSFLFAVVGVFPLYWMPPIGHWLTLLRHIKTIPFFFSIFLLASGLIIFVKSILNKNKKEK